MPGGEISYSVSACQFLPVSAAKVSGCEIIRPRNRGTSASIVCIPGRNLTSYRRVDCCQSRLRNHQAVSNGTLWSDLYRISECIVSSQGRNLTAYRRIDCCQSRLRNHQAVSDEML